ncbi:hypothetical protein FHU41_000399 [Psychromicrobium silvestre]|uniref:Uncharacterized protein n=1 Tax=Psychromicrobium silvestre TaxID=1645614 RepID=A0A7Y9LRD0_9MICC|nr:hypothetical protein [Psychromicrobium silvestre]NYE94178.1 hypothetical protein [Psychromicrobium silvestre]
MSGKPWLVDRGTALFWSGVAIVMFLGSYLSQLYLGLPKAVAFPFGLIGILLLPVAFVGLLGMPLPFLRAPWWRELHKVRKAWGKLDPNPEIVPVQERYTPRDSSNGAIFGWEVGYQSIGTTSEDLARGAFGLPRMIRFRTKGELSGDFALSQAPVDAEMLVDDRQVIFVQRPRSDFANSRAWTLVLSATGPDQLRTIQQDGVHAVNLGEAVFTVKGFKPLLGFRLKRALRPRWFRQTTDSRTGLRNYREDFVQLREYGPLGRPPEARPKAFNPLNRKQAKIAWAADNRARQGSPESGPQ